jgi:acetolactate decarboxylase
MATLAQTLDITMKILNYIILLPIILLILSCGASEEQEVNHESNNFKVEYSGALKNIMHKGDVSANSNLADFENTEHFYALGALENLKGEIQIFDSRPFNTLVIDSALTFDNSFNKKATLLVYASVRKWKSITIPDSVISYEQFENYIAHAAKANHLPIDEPFPFLLEGNTQSFDWHVIDWKDGDTEHSHEKHINSGLNGVAENSQVEMLGFYSDSHHAIFTHHTTNMHIHVKTVDNKIAGHVDDLTLGEGMILKIPDLD